MAKKITPNAPATVSATVEKSADKPTRKRKERKPMYAKSGSTKPARGLKGTPKDWNRETHRISRGQFAAVHYYFLHIANEHKRQAREYLERAKDAKANPHKYARAGGVKKAELAKSVDKLTETLVALLVSQGMDESAARAQVEAM